MNAVSYLNSTPLVWGMQYGPQKPQVDLNFSIPSECALDIERGGSEVGLVPVAEIARQGLEIVPGVGITCKGSVRSILLFSRVPFSQIKTMAADASSRTSVHLARVILRELYGSDPRIFSQNPILREMLTDADAALIIGDPALMLEPETLGFEWLDLGTEWFRLTRLPMVFAAWAGKPGIPTEPIQKLTLGSYNFGKAHLAQIVDEEHKSRRITHDLANRYLSENIRFQIGAQEQRGLEAFLELADLGKPALVGQN
ncbi:MAG: menaquinone biosynthesis protein [Acidobacteriota bacterium]|nr:menaquinone biosynthesis protein [Acidobacteriota bacterium]